MAVLRAPEAATAACRAFIRRSPARSSQTRAFLGGVDGCSVRARDLPRFARGGACRRQRASGRASGRPIRVRARRSAPRQKSAACARRGDARRPGRTAARLRLRLPHATPPAARFVARPFGDRLPDGGDTFSGDRRERTIGTAPVASARSAWPAPRDSACRSWCDDERGNASAARNSSNWSSSSSSPAHVDDQDHPASTPRVPR